MDKKSKHKTRVKKKTLNPEFNEVNGAEARNRAGLGPGVRQRLMEGVACPVPGVLLRDGALHSGQQDSGSHSLGL